jgi:VWFA-related protein
MTSTAFRLAAIGMLIATSVVTAERASSGMAASAIGPAVRVHRTSAPARRTSAPVHRTAPDAPVHRTAPLAPVAPVAPVAPEQSPRPQFETRADVVLVDVTVVSSNGEPVEGLTAADFQLTVNGQPRDVNTVQYISSRSTASVEEPARLAEVSSNERESTGRLLLFVVDENYLRVGAARTVLRAAERVMERLLPGDLVGLARLPTGRGGVEFTTDRSRIRRALSGMLGQQPPRQTERVRLSEAAALERNDQNLWQQVVDRECGATENGAGGGFQREACIHELEAQASQVLNDASSRTRVSIKAFEDLTRRLALTKVPVNIVLISEGLFVGRDRNDLSTLARLAAQGRVSFFVVQPDESMFDMDTPRLLSAGRDDSVLSEGLEQLAGFTRGSYYRVASSGTGAFERIGRELSGYYLLAFEPNAADRQSRDRRIKVEVRRRGLTVRARSTFALTEDAASTAAVLPPEEQVQGLLRAPLPASGLPIRLASYSVVNAADTRVRVILSAEIGGPATAAEEVTMGLVVLDKEDKVIAEAGGPMTLAPATTRTPSPRLLLTSVVLEPGQYSLRLAAVAKNGEAGSVHHTIDAKLPPLGRDTVRVSDLIVTSELDPPRPTPSAVIYTETANVVLELTGEDAARLAAAKVEVHVSENEASPPLVTAAARPLPRSDAQRGYIAGLKLGVLPPGEYVATAVINVPGAPETTLVRPFRLAPVAAPTDAAPAVALPGDDPPAPLPVARIVAPVAAFAVGDVLKPEVVRPFLDTLLKAHPVSPASAEIVRRAREGQFATDPPDGRTPDGDEPALAFVRGLAALEKKQYAQAAAWFQLTLKQASDFLGAAFYLGSVHAASGRDNDAVGAWQMSLIGDAGPATYPLLVDGPARMPGSNGATGPEALPKLASRPKGARQSSDFSKVSRPTESYTTFTPRPPVISFTRAAKSSLP